MGVSQVTSFTKIKNYEILFTFKPKMFRSLLLAKFFPSLDFFYILDHFVT